MILTIINVNQIPKFCMDTKFINLVHKKPACYCWLDAKKVELVYFFANNANNKMDL